MRSYNDQKISGKISCLLVMQLPGVPGGAAGPFGIGTGGKATEYI